MNKIQGPGIDIPVSAVENPAIKQAVEEGASFMEAMGQPNMATIELNKIKEAFAGGNFDNIDDLQNFLNAQMSGRNDQKLDDFLGLSPNHMDLILTKDVHAIPQIIAYDWEQNIETLQATPVIKKALWMMEKIEGGGGLKVNKDGAFKSPLVKEIHTRFGEYQYGYKQDEFPRKEVDSSTARILRGLLFESALMQWKEGECYLTNEGKRLLKAPNPRKLYKLFFLSMANHIPWIVGKVFPDALNFIQDSLVFNLYMLKKKASDFISCKDLSALYMKAFPMLAGNLHPKDGPLFCDWGFERGFLMSFAYDFGLVERQEKEPRKEIYSPRFRTTELFDKLLVWKV